MVEHPPAFTTEQSGFLYWRLRGVGPRPCFDQQKKTQYYLLIATLTRSHWIWMISGKWPTGSAATDSLAEKCKVRQELFLHSGPVEQWEKDIQSISIKTLSERSWPSIPIPMKKRSLLRPRLVPIFRGYWTHYETFITYLMEKSEDSIFKLYKLIKGNIHVLDVREQGIWCLHLDGVRLLPLSELWNPAGN